MIVPKHIRDKWNQMRSRGDQTEISGSNAALRNKIARAMSGKKCDDETFILIRDFYKKRENLLQTA